MKRSLFRYFSAREWAEDFLSGNVLFRPLAYFQAYEDRVRGDRDEGQSIYSLQQGLEIHNQTTGVKSTWSGWSFKTIAHLNEIFVYCLSRVLTPNLQREFDARFCVEITNVPAFLQRVRSVIAPEYRFIAGRVDYYYPGDAPGVRWALPDKIALSKTVSYQHQAEFRIVFGPQDAFRQENLDMILTNAKSPPSGKMDRDSFPIQSTHLTDICRLHVFD